jgi:hypothetical protein
MKTLPASNKIPAWQSERAYKKLQRACLRIKAAIQRGEPITRTIRRVARSMNGKPYRCDPSRRLALSPASLRRFWDKWRRGGEVPAAFALNYFPSHRIVYASLLIQFVNLCTAREFRNFKTAWQVFCAPGRRGKKPTYDTLLRNLPPGCFKTFRCQWKIIRQAQMKIARARLNFIAKILESVPERAPRRRLAPGNNFEI